MLKVKFLTCAVVGAMCVLDGSYCMRGNERYALIDDSPSEEFRLYKVDAKLEKASAQFHVGYMYFWDEGCGSKYATEKKRKRRGIHWLKKALKNGHCEAAYHLYGIYSDGLYGKKDRKKALEYSKRGAELWQSSYADEWPLESLRIALYAGREDVADKYRFRYLLKDANDGDAESAYEVATNYYNGSGVCSRNMVEAAKYFKIPADKGNAKAAHMLGICYENQYNHDQALKYHMQCANAGIDLNSPNSISVISAYKTARLYRDKGKFIENLENAVKYCKIAANAEYSDAKYMLSKFESELQFLRLVKDANSGNYRAAYELGMLYNDGSHCVERDAYEAVKYFKIAADDGNLPEAAYMLGVCYNKGENAIKYYKKCADARYRIYSPDSISIASAYKLAKLYMDRGCNIENLENAIKYCKIAANASYSSSKAMLKALEDELKRLRV